MERHVPTELRHKPPHSSAMFLPAPLSPPTQCLAPSWAARSAQTPGSLRGQFESGLLPERGTRPLTVRHLRLLRSQVDTARIEVNQRVPISRWRTRRRTQIGLSQLRGKGGDHESHLHELRAAAVLLPDQNHFNVPGSRGSAWSLTPCARWWSVPRGRLLANVEGNRFSAATRGSGEVDPRRV